MQIGPGRIVELEYELKVKGGDVIETSARTGALRYTHGDGRMLPGLEKRLIGLSPGDERSGEIPAREAFGTEEAMPTKDMPRNAFPSGAAPKVGAVFAAKDPTSGAPVQFKVVSWQPFGSLNPSSPPFTSAPPGELPLMVTDAPPLNAGTACASDAVASARP